MSLQDSSGPRMGELHMLRKSVSMSDARGRSYTWSILVVLVALGALLVPPALAAHLSRHARHRVVSHRGAQRVVVHGRHYAPPVAARSGSRARARNLSLPLLTRHRRGTALAARASSTSGAEVPALRTQRSRTYV